jgi:hypothetical protein
MAKLRAAEPTADKSSLHGTQCPRRDGFSATNEWNPANVVFLLTTAPNTDDETCKISLQRAVRNPNTTDWGNSTKSGSCYMFGREQKTHHVGFC